MNDSGIVVMHRDEFNQVLLDHIKEASNKLAEAKRIVEAIADTPVTRAYLRDIFGWSDYKVKKFEADGLLRRLPHSGRDFYYSLGDCYKLKEQINI